MKINIDLFLMVDMEKIIIILNILIINVTVNMVILDQKVNQNLEYVIKLTIII